MKKKITTAAISAFMILSLISVIAIQTPLVSANPEDPIAVKLEITGAGSANWTTELKHSGDYSVHLTAGASGGNEARIVIPMPEGTTLGDIETISWWIYTVAGYPAHVDITLDVDNDGYLDDVDMLTAEMAYNNSSGNELDNGLEPTLGSWLKTFELTLDDGYGQIDNDTMLWVTKMGAGNDDAPWGTLRDWKDGIVANDPEPDLLAAGVIDASAPVLRLEIEVDDWVLSTEVYVDDITINGETYDLEPRVINENTGAGYDTIQAAIDAASPGDTVLVGSGTYNEDITINKGNLTLRSTDGADVTIIDGTGVAVGTTAVTIQASGITFQGFTVQNFKYTPTTGIGAIWVLGDNAKVDSNIVKDIESDTEDPAGIGIDVQTEYARNVQITNNVVHDVGSIGIRVRDSWSTCTGVSNALIENNVVYRTANTGILITGYAKGVTIRNNEIYESLEPTPYSLFVHFASSDVLIENNYIHDSLYSNVVLAGCENVTISNNTIRGAPTWDGRAGKNIYILDDYGWGTGTLSENIRILNNEIKDGDYGVWIRYTGTVEDDETRMATTTKINYNNFVNNVEYGVFNDVGGTLDATLNWWGDPSGPSGVGLGSGDAVSANVDYRPWLRMPVGEDETPPTIEDALAIPDMISLITSTDGMSTGPEYTYLVVEVVETYGLGNVTLNFRPLLDNMFVNVEFEDQDAWEDFLGYYAEVGMELQDGLWVYEFYSQDPIDWLFDYNLVDEDDVFRILSEEIVLGDFTIPVTFSGYYYVYDEFGNPVPVYTELCDAIELAIVDLMVPLEEGWNLRSTPVTLANPRWGDVTSLGREASLSYDVALRLDVATQEWEVVDSDYPLSPLEAIYIHATEKDQIGLIFSRELTAPPMRQLELGWNLVGYAPPVDIWCYWEGANFSWDEMHVREAMVSIEETSDGNTGYDIVISPREDLSYEEVFQYNDYEPFDLYYKYFEQESWVYTAKPWEYDVEWDMWNGGYWEYIYECYMQPFCGYKVFMENPDWLAGFNETPLTWDYY